MPTPLVLVLDVHALLDDTAVGKAAATSLMEEARGLEALRKEISVAAAELSKGKQPQGAAIEADAATKLQQGLVALERKRQQLRRAMLARAIPIVDELRKKKRATVVVEASAALSFDPEADITKEVATRVDALGPLQIPQA